MEDGHNSLINNHPELSNSIHFITPENSYFCVCKEMGGWEGAPVDGKPIELCNSSIFLDGQWTVEIETNKL